MNVKKVLGMAFSVLILSSLFIGCGENGSPASYQNLLAKGKKYEADGNLVYALGSYWDAMESQLKSISSESGFEDLSDYVRKNPSLVDDEAYKRWTEITDCIKSGKPVLTGESLGKFEMHDKWDEIKKSFEKYWSDNCSLDVSFHSLSEGAVDYKNKSTKYNVMYSVSTSNKFANMLNCICEGYGIAFAENGWTDEKEEKWPVLSVYNGYESEAKKDGVSLLFGVFGECKGWIVAGLLSFYDITFDVKSPAGEVVLKNGHVLCVPQYVGHIVSEIRGVTFDQKTSESMEKLLKNDKYNFQITKAELFYGDVDLNSSRLEKITEDFDLDFVESIVEGMKKKETKVSSSWEGGNILIATNDIVSARNDGIFISKYGEDPLLSKGGIFSSASGDSEMYYIFKDDGYFVFFVKEGNGSYSQVYDGSYYCIRSGDSENSLEICLNCYEKEFQNLNFNCDTYELSTGEKNGLSLKSAESSPITFEQALAEKEKLIKADKERRAKKELADAMKNGTKGWIQNSDMSKVNIRSTPSSSGKLVGQFMPDEEIVILEESDNYDYFDEVYDRWVKATNGTLTGWIFGGFVRRDFMDDFDW